MKNGRIFAIESLTKSKIMRKNILLAAATVMLALPLSFSSCDNPDYDFIWGDNNGWDGHHRPGENEDDDFYVRMAQTIARQWRGSMRAYALDENNIAIDSIDYDTDIEFIQYNSQSIAGTGTQWDYTPHTDHLEYMRDFTWSIDTKTGDINLIYKELGFDNQYHTYTMTIPYDQLNLDDHTFTGYLWSEDGTEVDDFWWNRYSQSNTRSAADKKGAVKWKVVIK